ncbi:MAG: serine/threonine dehydratase [Acidimicrobiia bacterium]
MAAAPISRIEIIETSARIGHHIRRSPLVDLGDALDAGFNLSLKLESIQPTGSFKVRGAFSALTASIMPERGVVAASGGNFGLAVAYAANEMGIPATIFAPATSPGEKLDRIEALGAQLHRVSGQYPAALEAAINHAKDDGSRQLHAYDQREVVAGQGTCGLEISDQAPDASTVLVAVGGGGLIAGIASALDGMCKVVGVEPEKCPTLHSARAAGRPVEVEVGGIAVSSLGASRIGQIAWETNHLIDGSVLVTDDDLVEAQRWLWESCRLVAEPAAAAPVAALLAGAYRVMPGENVVCVVSGANTDPKLVA